jgi:hypothetical protein
MLLCSRLCPPRNALTPHREERPYTTSRWYATCTTPTWQLVANTASAHPPRYDGYRRRPRLPMSVSTCHYSYLREIQFGDARQALLQAGTPCLSRFCESCNMFPMIVLKDEQAVAEATFMKNGSCAAAVHHLLCIRHIHQNMSARNSYVTATRAFHPRKHCITYHKHLM